MFNQAQVFGEELKAADDNIDDIFSGVIGFADFSPLGQLIDEARGELTATEESQALAMIEIIGSTAVGILPADIIVSCSLAASHRYSVRRSFQVVYQHVYGHEADI